MAWREESKIRERFPIYIGLPAAKVTTLSSPDTVVTEILNVIERNAAPLDPPG